MKIIKTALILAILLIFSENIKAQNKMENEFYENDNKETLYKGIYLGKITKDDKEFFKFQFDGVLKGENRFLEVYFETNIDKETEKTAFLRETDKPAKSEDFAYLLFKNDEESSSDLSYKLKNNQYGVLYDFSRLPKSPDAFFKPVNAENENIKDSVFVVSIVANKHDDFFVVELLLWIKTTDGKYLPERYQTQIDKKSEALGIKIKGYDN